MEYGYEIVDAGGNTTFFVEGCTYCRMSTGGVHELDCPYYEPLQRKETYAEFGERLKLAIAEHPEWSWSLL